MKSILVVCEGNHCRSPIAEVLFGSSLGPEFCVSSAGLTALAGVPADIEAIRIMAENGFDLTRHRGRQLTPAIALSADLILVMEHTQKDWCERVVPSTRGRIFLLGHWLATPPPEIADPFHRGPEAFKLAFDSITHSVAAWLPRLINKQRSA